MASRTFYLWCFAAVAIGLILFAAMRSQSLALEIAALAVAALFIGILFSTKFLVPKLDGDPAPQPAAMAIKLSANEILDALPNPAILFNGQGVATLVNAAARQAFRGLDVGIGLHQWFRDSSVLDGFAKVIAGSGPLSVELLEKRPLERAFKIEILAIDQPASNILLVFSEHTEALRVDRMRADFIANASHELRTPLTAVTGFLETLQGPARNDPVNRERFISLMLEQTQRMARLIDDLLSLSRLETQSAPTKLQNVDVGQLAATTLAALAGLAAQHEVTIHSSLSKGTLMVEGDPDELTQVLQNLIENAIKYGASGKRIEIGLAAPNAREVGFSVRDYGAGIASEYIPRLTERFYRVDVEASRQQKGTGLGLAIVKHILTRHRARLVIESRQGEGSTFSVLFPKTA